MADPKRTTDPTDIKAADEFEVMRKCTSAIAALKGEAQQRVVYYLVTRFPPLHPGGGGGYDEMGGGEGMVITRGRPGPLRRI